MNRDPFLLILSINISYFENSNDVTQMYQTPKWVTYSVIRKNVISKENYYDKGYGHQMDDPTEIYYSRINNKRTIFNFINM